jgi:hypothetical protein
LLLVAQPDAPADREWDELMWTLDSGASVERRSRNGQAIAQGVMGATLVGVGVALFVQTSQTQPHLLGVGMIVGGGIQLATWPLLFLRSPMEKLRDRARELQSSGMPLAEALDVVRREWQQQAARRQRLRPYLGAGEIILGAGALAAGLALLFDPAIDPKAQPWGSALAGVAVPLLGQGVRLLVEQSSEETSWESYERSARRRASSLPTFGVAPVSQGAALMVSGFW